MAKKQQKISADASPTPASVPPNDAPKVIRANIKRELVTDSGFVSLYANDTQIQLTPWDFRLIFGQIANVPTPENPTIQVRQIGEVRMSPQHAKKITLILIGQLKHYEETIGPIPLPSD
jgi:hypothetical protein